MAAYLTLALWKARTKMASADVDDLEGREPGKIDSFLLARSERALNARLRKRYAAPFVAPYPEAVLSWLTDLVTFDAFMLRGFNPSSMQDQLVADEAKRAEAEILEAANSDVGLFDLPLRQDTTTSGIARGGPFGYAEASPYAWIDRQRERVQNGE